LDKVRKLMSIAQKLASERPSFFKVKGAGAGDRDTNSFMAELRARANLAFGLDLSEQRICGDNHLAVDFFFPEEQTVVEVALSLRNPNSEFERDIIKTVMAKEFGSKVRRLLFVCKPGAIKKHSQPSSKAIMSWAKRTHDVQVEIRELASPSKAKT